VKKKHFGKKLVLSSEKVRDLSQQELEATQGGAYAIASGGCYSVGGSIVGPTHDTEINYQLNIAYLGSY
jgi:hypothetical protein